MTGTVITTVTAEQFRARIARLMPPGWAGADAMQTGLAAGLLRAIGGGLSDLVTEIQYTADATRLTTETSPELDLASVDYFGDALPRPSGMTDSAFAALIIANLFKSAATRPAISAAIQAATGVAPRVLEPWNIFDSGTWGNTTYWNVDTPTFPGRWGGYIPYQGFIETPVPAVPVIGPNNPILCWGDGAYWNVPGYFFGVISSPITSSIASIVKRLKAEGTVVWLKNVLPPTQPFVQSISHVGGRLTVTWTSAGGTPPISYTMQYQRDVPNSTWFSSASTPGNSFTQAGLLLPAQTKYLVRIIAANAAGNATSPIAGENTPPPTAPTGVSLSHTGGSVTVNWTASIGPTPITYTVQLTTNGDWNNVVASVSGVVTTSATLSGLLPPTAQGYYARVTAINAYGRNTSAVAGPL